jgi:hypothetical protein
MIMNDHLAIEPTLVSDSKQQSQTWTLSEQQQKLKDNEMQRIEDKRVRYSMLEGAHPALGSNLEALL